MYVLTVESVFSAAHAILIRGEREPLHGHDWRVTVTIEGERLDEDGLLCDFHHVERALQEITAQFHNRSLNQTPPFDEINPTAELVARHIGDRLVESVTLSRGARVAGVRVTEAVGCAAEWRA
jgi:6-pyruvoyltetrahydropterin/6-carboxytetrahydropterin synthase